MTERRNATRRSVDVFFNKFLDGYPYLCRSVDVSETGVLVDTYAEPEMEAVRFPLELRLPGERRTLWLWAKSVRSDGRTQAFEFVSMSTGAQKQLRRWLTTAA